MNNMDKKLDFTNIKVQVSFDGTMQTFNVAKVLGNSMKYTGSVVGDIGFDKLAEEIYYSQGEVSIPIQYLSSIIHVINDMPLVAAVKRYLLDELNK